jgi:hypothetical protein
MTSKSLRSSKMLPHMAATIDIRAELERARLRSVELEELIHRRQPFPLQSDRQMLIAGYFALMVDYHRSVLFLLKPEYNLCGGGFALARPMVEALLRIHIVAQGSECDVKCIKADRYRTNFEDVADELDELFKLEFFAKTFNSEVRRALHSYTHSGTMQIARRFDGTTISPSYRDGEKWDMIRMCTLAFAMGTVIMTATLGFDAERVRANEVCSEYTKDPSYP